MDWIGNYTIIFSNRLLINRKIPDTVWYQGFFVEII